MVNNIYGTHQAKVERSNSKVTLGQAMTLAFLSFISFFITENIFVMGAHLRLLSIVKVRQK